jgi:hypothetical protein
LHTSCWRRPSRCTSRQAAEPARRLPEPARHRLPAVQPPRSATFRNGRAVPAETTCRSGSPTTCSGSC